MSVSALTLITDALIEVGVIGENQTPSSPDSERGLRILNRDIMDAWNVERFFATHRVFTTGTFATSTATRAIGPSGTGSFVLTPRPIELLGADYVRTADTPDSYTPINIRDAEWYKGLPQPLFEGSQITDIYYDPSVPDGTMYAWPVPDASQTVRVLTLSVLAQFAALATTADFAPGYERAVSETLKELFCRAWHRPKPEGLAESAMAARAAVQLQNLTRRRPLISDAPSTMCGPVSSDSTGFRTRQF